MATLHSSDCALTMHLDIKRTVEVARQFIRNALTHTETGPIILEVGLTRESTGARLRLSVVDEGAGISSDRLESIFDAFTCAEAPMTWRNSGLGLGLALCQRLAHMLGGEVSATSTMGRGSRFELCVPVALASQPTAELDRAAA